MKESLYLIFAVIPAFLWIYYFYKHDRGEKEPKRLLILAAVFGAIAVIPAAFLEIFITKNIIPFFFPQIKAAPISAYSTFAVFLILNLIVVSVVEEVLKFLSVRLTVYNSERFNEISDGIVYMVTAAFGFAAFENFLYFLNFGNEVIFVRSLFTPLFHASASAVVGHYLGLAKWDKKFRRNVYLALIFSIVLHFLYNFLVFFSSFAESFFYIILAILLLAFSGKWMMDKFKECEDMDEECTL